MKKRHKSYDLTNGEWELLISSWVQGERNREILREFIVDDISTKELASKYSLSVQGVQKIVYRWEDEIFPKAADILASRNEL